MNTMDLKSINLGVVNNRGRLSSLIINIFLVALISLMTISCSDSVKDLENKDLIKIELDKSIDDMTTDEKFFYLKSKTDELKIAPFDIIKESYNDVNTLFSKNTGIYSPSGICAVDDNFAVLDGEKGNIKIIDKDGNLINTIGKLGSGNMEFKLPSAICYNKKLEKIYIYDAGNKRIVKLNKDFSFIENIKINFPKNDADINISNETHIGSIAVGDDEVFYFLPQKSNNKDTARLLKFKDSEQIKKYDGAVVGHVKLSDNRIFIVETDQIFDFGKILFPTSGENRVFEIIENNIVKVGNLPYRYKPYDIEVVEDKLYAYSSSWLTLDEFDIKDELNHIRTLTPQLTPDKRDRGFGRHASMARINNKIAICDRFTGNIYIVDISDNKNK